MKKNKKLGISLAAAGMIMGLTYTTNKLIFYCSTLRKLLTSENSFLYEWRFGNVHYIKKGSGKPIVLLHDLNSVSSVYEWKSIIDKLVKNHTVYAIDLLGCGYSDKPKMTYTNYLFVQMLNDFIKEIIRGKVDVIASSSSSSIVLMACHMEPKLYHKLMLINPKSPIDFARVPKFYHKLYRYLIEIPIFGTLIYNLRTAFYVIRWMFIKKYYNAFELINKDDIRAYHEAAHTGGSASKYLHASICSRFTNIPIYEAVKNIDRSIVIVGGSEVNHIHEILNKYSELNPAIETVIIENTKFMPQLEMPEKLEEIISIYL